MAGDDPRQALITGFFAVLRDGALGRLQELMAEDCVDHDPLPGQPAGRAGVALKVALFRAAHRDARITVEAIEPDAGGARVAWSTTARGLGGAPGEATRRFVSRFEIEGGKIRSSKLEESRPIDG
jgi:ketosteroid isomerase-like protein